MLLFPASKAKGADGEVRRVAMARGAEPVRRGVLGERHVSDAVQGFDVPVAADQPGELGGCARSAVRLVTA